MRTLPATLLSMLVILTLGACGPDESVMLLDSGTNSRADSDTDSDLADSDAGGSSIDAATDTATLQDAPPADASLEDAPLHDSAFEDMRVDSGAIDAALPTPKLMVIGDSITEGSYPADTYRYHLSRALNAEGVAIDFVGPNFGTCYAPTAGEDGSWDPQHAGFSQATSVGILSESMPVSVTTCDTVRGAGNMGDWAPRYAPDIAVIHLGTNDCSRWSSRDPAVVRRSLSGIVRALRAAVPTVKFVVAQLITSTLDPAQNSCVLELNASLPAWAASLSTEHSPIVLVDQATGWNPSLLADGIHPNAAGAIQMAARFLPAVRAFAGGMPPTMPPTSTSHFGFDSEGDSEGWTVSNMVDIGSGPRGGTWILRVDGDDPSISSPTLDFEASSFRTLQVTMANDHNPLDSSVMQVFWSTNSARGFREAHSASMVVSNGGGWATYSFDLSSAPGWTGVIEQIRIDPIIRGDGHTIGLDAITLVP